MERCTDIQEIILEKESLNYKRYIIVDDRYSGRIVLECYNGIWNLELMSVTPRNIGVGSYFLNYVLTIEKLNPQNMTVCPLDDSSRRFFKRHGFNC